LPLPSIFFACVCVLGEWRKGVEAILPYLPQDVYIVRAVLQVERSPEAMMREVASHGPIACAINALPLTAFDGVGVIEDLPEVPAEHSFGVSMG
jgi:hypothetical protein